jgi:hypothetical protein
MGTVLPGLIEGHNHMFKIGDYPGTGSDAAVPLVVQPGTPFSPPFFTLLAAKNAKLDLESGFTTARDLSSGGTADVDLRTAINAGVVPGPRMVIATEGMRGSTAGPRYFHLVDSPSESLQPRARGVFFADGPMRWSAMIRGLLILSLAIKGARPPSTRPIIGARLLGD